MNDPDPDPDAEREARSDELAAAVGADGETASGLRKLFDRGSERAKADIDRANRRLGDLRERQSLVDLGFRLWERDKESAGTVVASAFAFRLFLFFAPFMLFLVGVAGFIANAISAEDASNAVGAGGAFAQQLNDAFAQHRTTRWVAVLTGLVGMLWAGRTVGKVLVAASSLSWRQDVARKASLRLLGSLVGLLVGLGLVTVFVSRIQHALGLAVAGFSVGLAAIAYTALWMLLMARLPRGTTDPGALLPGGLLAGLTMAALQGITQLYLPGRFDRASALYGALGTSLVVLGWFFVIARVVVFSLTVNAVVYERHGSLSQVFFGLPVVRILPRHSPHLAKWFDLPPSVYEKRPERPDSTA